MDIQETTAKVIKIISQVLSSGCPTEEVIAFEMCMSKRTLQRRLNDEGHSFSELLNTVRHTMAKQLLSTTNMPSTEIAYQLGYSSPSTFARAFKHQVDVSPTEYRKQSLSTGY